MPQSPRWLVMSGDDFAARATLAKIRVDDPDTIDRELDQGQPRRQAGRLGRAAAVGRQSALLVGVGLAILQQVTGINTVIFQERVERRA